MNFFLSTLKAGWPVIELGILTLLSACFSACETAYIAASRARLHVLAKGGNKKAAKVLGLKGKMSTLISTILLCNTLINILASALATKLFLEQFGEVGVVYATCVMGIVIVVYAEVIPKIIGIRHPEKLAMRFSSFVGSVVWICSPIANMLNRYAHLNTRLIGIRADEQSGKSEAAEELRGVIDLYGNSGEDARDERSMLQSILDLGDVCVDEVMIHRKNMFSINAGVSPREMIHQLLQCPFTRVPLWVDDPDNIVGILHVKALIRAIASHHGDIDSLDIRALALNPWFVPDTRLLIDQMHAFRRRHEHVALVVDEYGDLQGLITLEDILEEIVGDITDETDNDSAGIYTNNKGELFVEGSTTIRDLNRRYDWSLDDENASTIAGLLMEESRQIPDIGQAFIVSRLEMTVLRKVGNQITYVKIKPDASPDRNGEIEV